jgi:phytoene desaturase
MCSNPKASGTVLHLGVKQRYSKTVHHNLHFDRQGGDPPLLVTRPTWTDNSAAPPGGDTYCVQIPVTSTGAAARRAASELMAVLEARGYLDLGQHLEVSHVQTPTTYARATPVSPGTLPSTVVSTRLAVGVPMLLNAGKLAALRVLA